MSTLTIEATADTPDVACSTPSQQVEALVGRIRAEYAEMPGLNLTLAQAARLWNIDRRCTSAVLSRLLREGFLVRTSRGVYRREACPRCA